MDLTFLCDPEERHLPMAQRSILWVNDGPKQIALISANADADPSAERNQNSAIWQARLLHTHFNPFIHEHQPDPDGKPHVESDEEGFTSLVNPKTLTMAQARQWVRDNYHKANK